MQEGSFNGGRTLGDSEKSYCRFQANTAFVGLLDYVDVLRA
jgi:hypothetical protein